MYGEGNTAKLTGDMTKTIKQVTDGIKDSTGIDPLSLLVGAMGTKMIDKSGTMAQSAAAGALAQDTVKNEQTSVKKKKAEPEGE